MTRTPAAPRWQTLLAAVPLAIALAGSPAGAQTVRLSAPPGGGPITPTDTIRLFNGKDLSTLYTWIPETRYTDPLRVFTVVDQIDGAPAIRVSGELWGGLVTPDSYRDYHLVVEYRWGDETWGTRRNGARDSGILYHAQGPEGYNARNFRGPWIRSIEYQIIEGGVGDLILVGGYNEAGEPVPVSATVTVRRDRDNERVWDPAGQTETISAGRVNWYGRDVDWADRLGFRGREEVERPHGEWNTAEVIARGSEATHILNGKVVVRLTGASPSEGKLFFQSEGAEMYIRKIELRPLR